MPLPFLTPDNQPITWRGRYVFVTLSPRQFYWRDDRGKYQPITNPPQPWLTAKLNQVTHQLNR